MHFPKAAVLAFLVTAASLAGQSAPAGRTREAMFVPLLSGDYREDQSLVVDPLLEGLVVRYRFRSEHGGEGPWVRYRGPVPLTAAPGEEREYHVLLAAESDGREVERRAVDVRIDRRAPAPPQPIPGPGRYWEPVEVRFTADAGLRVYWGFGDEAFTAPRPWDGKPVVVGRAGTRTQSTLLAWSEDAAGNRSVVAALPYTVDARAPELDLQSPVPGTFANPQLLFLSFRNVAWIRYTTDGSDPAVAGTPYTGPVTINRRGDVQVRVAAAPRSGRGVIRRDVRFTWQPDQGTGLVVEPPSGITRGPVTVRTVSAPVGTVYATLDEKTPVAHDIPAGDAFTLVPSGSTRAVTLRFRCLAPDGSWGAEYRYVHVLAGPPPAAPVVATPSTALRSPTSIGIEAAEDALVYASLDGSDPAASSPVADGAVTVAPAPASRSSVPLRAVCMDATGAFSAECETEIRCNTTPGTIPELIAAAAPPGNVEIRADLAADPGLTVVYEIASADREAPVPTADSPLLPRPLVLTVPFGMARTFSVRCATVDGAAQVVAVGRPVTLSIDRAPPPRPAVIPAPDPLGFDVPVAVHVDSQDLIRYSLADDGRSPPDPSADSPTAVGDIRLPGKPGSRTEYRIKLVAIDGAGNSSEVYGPLQYVVDLTPPRLPPIDGIEQNGIYGSRQVVPRLGPGTAQVRYTATSDGSVPPEPGPDAAVLGPDTVFTGEPGQERTWRVKLLALSSSGAITGERRELSFLIDLKPPEVPGVGGFVERGRYAAPVVAVAVPVPPATILYLSWSQAPREPDDPVAADARYDGPITFDTAEGTSATFVLRAASRDLSGNRSLYDRYYRFTVDREPPSDPEILDVPESGVAAGPVTVSLAFSEGTARYEVTDDGSLPRLPDESSPRYESPFLLAGRPDEAVPYCIAVRAVDDLGNESPGTRTARVVVDRTVPAPPPAPRVSFAGASGSAWLQWDPPFSGRILYRIRAEGAYAPYTGPVLLAPASLAGGMVDGDAVMENAAGTRSDPTPFRLAVVTPLARPVVTGPHDGAVVSRRVDVRAEAARGDLRCEVRSDGGFPPTVTTSSPLAEPTVSFDVSEGETRSFTIAYRAFDPTGVSLPSEPAVLSFTIDRTPPEPPILQGLADGAFAEGGRTVTLLAAEGAIYYALSSDGREPPMPSATEAARYQGPITLAARSGSALTYRILGYTIDPAGNRSRAMLAWSATIDQATVYTAPDGNDAAAGTRSDPVRTLSRAIVLASQTGRPVVRLAYGEYALEAGLSLGPGMTMIGGLERDTWTTAGLGRRSVLVPSVRFKARGTLLSGAAGAVTLSGIELRDETGRTAALLSLAGTALAARDVAFVVRGDGARTAIAASAATVQITDSSFTAEQAANATLAAVTGGTVTFTGCTFSGPSQSEDFTCIAATDGAGLFVVGSVLDPGSGVKVRGIRASGSSLTLENTRIWSGAGLLEATGVDIHGGTIVTKNCDFETSPEAVVPVCLRSDGSTVSVEGSRMQVTGQSGAAGIAAHGGTVAVLGSQLHGGRTAEYLYLVRGDSADVEIGGCTLAGGETGDLSDIIVRDSRLDVHGTTIASGQGRISATAIASHGPGNLEVASTVIAAPQESTGPAIIAIRSGKGVPADLAVRSCCFGGWERLIGFDPTSGIRDVATVDDLNGLDGDPFGGTIDGCIVEDPSAVFEGATDYRVSPASQSYLAGIGALTSGE